MLYFWENDSSAEENSHVLTFIHKFWIVRTSVCLSFFSGYANVELRSEGCYDYGKGPGCGKGYIWINGRDYSKHRRGMNVIVMDYRTGKQQTDNWLLNFPSVQIFSSNIREKDRLNLQARCFSLRQKRANFRLPTDCY